MFCCHYVSLCLTCLPGNKYWRKLLFHYLTSTDLSSMRSYGYLRTVLDVNKSNWCGPRHCQTVWWYIVSTQPASAICYNTNTLRYVNETRHFSAQVSFTYHVNVYHPTVCPCGLTEATTCVIDDAGAVGRLQVLSMRLDWALSTRQPVHRGCSFWMFSPSARPYLNMSCNDYFTCSRVKAQNVYSLAES